MLQRKSELVSFVKDALGKFDTAFETVPELLEESAKKIRAEGGIGLKTIENGELLIPIVGGFSAGKSTAINSFLRRNILPVAITAETSIPTEIRYSTEEKVIAYNKENVEEIYSLSDLPSLTERAESFLLLKVFVDSQALKSISPFVFVDMPGFDSTLQQHNDAILRYLSSGAYYLFFVNSSDGTIKSSDLRRLAEIDGLEKDSYVVLSKSDLLPESRLLEVKEHISELVDDHLAVNNGIYTVGINDISAINSIVSASDPEQVFNQKYISEAKDIFYDVSSVLNSAINALDKTGQEKSNEINLLKSTLNDILNQKESKIQDIKEKSTGSYENQILSGIEKDLKGAMSELTSAMKQGDEALSRSVNDIVRASLMRELNRVTGNLSTNIVNDLSLKIGTDIFSNQTDWLEGVMSSLQSEVMSALTGTMDASTGKTEGAGKTLGGLLSNLAAAVPHPIAKVVLAILPGIVGALFDSYSQKSEEDKLRNTMVNDVIPNIKSQLRPKITESLNQVISSMVDAVSNQFEEKIVEKKQILEISQEQVDQDVSDLEAKKQSLKTILADINVSAEQSIM